MLKVIDIDSLFDKYIEGYVYKSVGKQSVEEIENNIPVLYASFGKEKLKELDGKSPEEYYKNYSASELLECLKKHVEQRVSVPDFLYESIREGDSEEEIKKLVKTSEDEEFTLYLLNLVSDMQIKGLGKRLLEFVTFDYGEPIAELSAEILGESADEVKTEILEIFNTASEQRKPLLLEVLSKATKSDEIFDILIAQFVAHLDNVPLYASYLSKYGDERALPFLQTAIESEKINYADFEELRFAIEALGGTCNVTRDFSNDKVYKAIKKNAEKNTKLS